MDDGNFVAYSLNAIDLPIGAIGEWSIMAGNGDFSIHGNKNDPKSGVSEMKDGINTFRWTVTNKDCPAYDDVNIAYISENFKAQVILSEINVCEDSAIISAKSAITGVGSWRGIIGDMKIKDPSSPITVVTGLKPNSRNMLYWEVKKNNYTSRDSVVIYNNSFSIYAGADLESCDDRVLLIGENPEAVGYELEEGEWGGIGAAETRNNDTTYVSALIPGDNKMKWTVRRRRANCPTCRICEAQDSLNIFYYALPKAEFETSSNEGCSPKYIKFENKTIDMNNSANTDIEYYWVTSDKQISRDPAPTFRFENNSGKDTVIFYTVTLKATIEHGGLVCKSDFTDSIKVFYTPLLDFSVSPESVEYTVSEVTVMLQNKIIEPSTSYKWDFGDDSNGTTKTTSHSYKWDANEYKVNGWKFPITLTAENSNCTNDTVHYLTVMPEPSTTLTVEEKDLSFSVYPNPFSDILNIDINFTSNSTFELKVLNLLGESVEVINCDEKSDENFSKHWQSRNLQKGVYILQLKTENQSFTKKIIYK